MPRCAIWAIWAAQVCIWAMSRVLSPIARDACYKHVAAGLHIRGAGLYSPLRSQGRRHHDWPWLSRLEAAAEGFWLSPGRQWPTRKPERRSKSPGPSGTTWLVEGKVMCGEAWRGEESRGEAGLRNVWHGSAL